MLVGAEAEMLNSLTSALGSTQDQGVASGRGTKSKLIQSDGLAAGSDNTSAGSGSEAQSSYGKLGEGEKAVVIGDGADYDHGALLLLVDVGDNARERHRWAVHLRHKQASEDNLVERSVGTA